MGKITFGQDRLIFWGMPEGNTALNCSCTSLKDISLIRASYQKFLLGAFLKLFANIFAIVYLSVWWKENGVHYYQILPEICDIKQVGSHFTIQVVFLKASCKSLPLETAYLLPLLTVVVFRQCYFITSWTLFSCWSQRI